MTMSIILYLVFYVLFGIFVTYLVFLGEDKVNIFDAFIVFLGYPFVVVTFIIIFAVCMLERD